VTLRKEKSVSLISDTSRNNRFNKRTQSQHSLRVNRETMNEPLRKIVEALKIRPRRRPKPKPEITTPYLQKLTIPQAIKKYDSQQSQMSRASDTFRSELVLN
jgi:phospholipase/lecithinase/hemolysin